MNRRMVLRGLGGAVLGLPLLESVGRADGAADEAPHCAVFVRQGNGVQQEDGEEPERYWPRTPGPIGASLATTDADRALSELAPYAERCLFVKGLRFAFHGTGCAHSAGGNQCLTAAQVSEDPDDEDSLALGESIDNRIARSFPHNGGEPLTLFTGPRNGYLEEVMSYRGPLDLRSAEDDPWRAYQRMIGLTRADTLLLARRQSVNDLVRDQMSALLARPDLSTSDRRRLELHFDSVREFETLACALAADDEQAMASLSGQGTLDANRLRVAELHCDLVALAFACDFARAATIQVGDGNDGTRYLVDGDLAPPFHQVSHRVLSDGGRGEPIDDALDLHHAIDRMHLGVFRHLLDRLDAYGILDTSIAVHLNDLATGASHGRLNVPFVIAGRGDGLLRTGRFVDVGDVTHNRLLNTLISATGLRKPDGGLVDDFGDPSLEGGVLAELLA